MATKGELTKERILQAAFQVIGKKGFYDASLEEVAIAAKVQRQGIINYYGDKPGLLRACVLRVLNEFGAEYEKRCLPTSSSLDRLNLQFQMNLEMATQRPERSRLILLLYYNASHDLEIGKIYAESIVRIRDRYQSMIEAGSREGSFRAVENAAIVGALLHEIIIGMVTTLLAGKSDAKEVKLMKKKWKWALSTFLGAG